MPVYQYKGVHYDLSTSDAAEAKRKIKQYLGEDLSGDEKYNAALKGNDVAPFAGAIANKGVDMLAAPAAGLRGLAEGVLREGPFLQNALEGMESTQQYVQDKLPRFTGEKTKLAEEALSEQWEEKVNKTGRQIGAVAGKYGLGGIPRLLMTPEQKGKYDAAFETGGEVAANVVADPLTPATIMAGARAGRAVPSPAVEAVQPLRGSDEALMTKATELAKSAGRELPTQTDYITAARLIEGERDPNAVQYTGPEITQPSPVAPKAAPLAEVPALDMPPTMGLESDTQAALRGALGPAERSARERIDTSVEQPVGDVNHLDPVALARQREAPEAGALPEGTAPYQAGLDFTKPAELGMPEARLNPRTEDGLYALPPDGAPFKYPEGEVIPDQRSLLPATSEDFNGFNFNEKLARLSSTVDQLDMIAKESGSELNRLLAEKIRETNPEYNAAMSVQQRITAREAGLKEGEAGIVRGLMDTNRGVVYSKEGRGHISENTILHENLHGVLGGMVQRYLNGTPLPRQLAPHIQNIDNLYKYIKDTWPEGYQGMYGLRDLHEFISEGLTNPEFRERLRETRIRPDKHSLYKLAETAWDAFTSAILRVLGIKPTRENMNAFAALLNETNAALKAIGADPRIQYLSYTKQALHWNDVRTGSTPEAFKAASKAEEHKPKAYVDYKEELKLSLPEDSIKRFGPALYEKYKEEFAKDNGPRPAPVGYDNRPHEEFKQDLYRKDGTQRIDDLSNPARGPAYPAANKHPVVRRVYDQVSQATVAKDNLFNKYYRATEIVDAGYINPLKGRFSGVTNLRQARRVESPDSVSVLKNKLTSADKQAILEVQKKFVGETAKQLDDPVSLRAAGLSSNGIKFIQALRKANKLAWEDANKARKVRGLAELPYREDFMWTHVRFGSYQVFGIKDGKHGYLAGFQNYADAQKVAAHMKAQGMDAYAAAAKDNPQHVVIPDDSFLAAERLLPDADSRRLFQTAVQEAIKRTGVNKYALRRDSTAGGFAGSTELVNTLGVDKAFDGVMKSVETYFRQMAGYAGSAEYLKRVGETLTDKDIARDYPNAMITAAEMKENFIGKDRLGDAELRAFSLWLGKQPLFKHFVSEQTGANFLVGTANVFVNNVLVWWNPVFYLASAMQHFLMPSRLAQINAKEFGGNGNLSAAMLKGQAHMFLPTTRSKELMMKAMDNGSIEPRFVEALDWVQSNSRLSNIAKTALFQKIAGLSDSFGRASAYMISFEFAKTLGLDDAKAHSFAARESQGVMIQYERWARMPVLNKLGVAGDAMAPLTHFVSNYAFNLGTYMKDAVAKGNLDHRIVAPAMLMLVSQLALAGIKGMPFYQDLEDLYLKLNKFWIEHGGERMPMPSEIMAEMGVPHLAQDGVVSTALGINATGTLGAGTIVGNIGETSALKYAWDIIKAVGTIADPTTTVNEKRAAMANLPPPIARQYLNNLLQGKTNPLEPADVLDSSGNLVYRRDEGEQLRSALTGRQSLGEAEAKKAKFQNQELESAEKEAKTKAKAAFVQALLEGAEPPSFVAKVFSRYPELYDEAAAELSKEQRILNKNVPYKVREVLKNTDKPRDLGRILDTHKNADSYANQR